MTYKLIVLTHGDEPPCLEQALDAFGAMVTPLPAETVIVRDGPGYSYIAPWMTRRAGRWACVQAAPEQLGFCAVTREAWRIAAQGDLDYVFWLEHDFVLARPVDLRQLAAVLDAHPLLAQMALMRDAVNAQEVDAGGLYESRPGQYEPQLYIDAAAPDQADWWRAPWLEHRAYLTTNPSLMRRAWMAEHPWPDHPAECEGRFGIDLVLQGHTFGVWGTGEPWCRHVGTRTGFGY